MRVLGYILTAAAILVGADIFVASSDPTDTQKDMTAPSLAGENGMPTPPPDAY